MVDPEGVELCLQRLEDHLARLERVFQDGWRLYSADSDRQAMTERRLQLAQQICIDLGAGLLADQAAKPAASYAAVFEELERLGVLEADLARHLEAAAGQCNVLVHAYLDVDPKLVFESLGHLSALRRFAAVVASRVRP